MINVLHVVSSLNVGGTQVLIKNLMKTDSFNQGYKHYFLVEDEKQGFFDYDIVNSGGVIIRGPKPSMGLIKYFLYLREIFFEKKISIIHSHVSMFSGVVVLFSWLLGIKVRVAHAHSLPKNNSSSYSRLMRLLINQYATKKIACSGAAGRAVFGKKGFRIIKNGISFDDCKSKNRVKIDSKKVKIAHVGRLVEEKNHKLLLKIIKENKDNFELHLIGGGSLEQEIKDLIEEYQIDKNVTMHGDSARPFDIAASCDVFAFPSKREGFGITVVEAQVNNLPIVMSENVPKDVIFIPSLVSTLSLDDDCKIWTDHIFRAVKEKPEIKISDIKTKFKRSGFDVEDTSIEIQKNAYI